LITHDKKSCIPKRSKCFLLAAPLFADSVEERGRWRQTRSYRVVEALSCQTDVTFVGIGEIGPGCPLQRDGFVDRKEVDELSRAGVVGEIMGWTFGEAGEEIRTWPYERVTSIPLLRPPERPVIAVAGGEAQSQGSSRGAARSLDNWLSHRPYLRPADPCQ
jgi:DNA-binding transcriptional regulator LsrR (DeoR family)